MLLIKSLGLALAVASGLSLGKEGPLVHVACCWAFLLSRALPQFKHNEGMLRCEMCNAPLVTACS